MSDQAQVRLWCCDHPRPYWQRLCDECVRRIWINAWLEGR